MPQGNEHLLLGDYKLSGHINYIQPDAVGERAYRVIDVDHNGNMSSCEIEYATANNVLTVTDIIVGGESCQDLVDDYLEIASYDYTVIDGVLTIVKQ
jgi:hypothetical protein